MANEIQLFYRPNQNLYAVVFDGNGLVWSVTASNLVTFNQAAVANYAIPMSSAGVGSPDYVASFPTAITTAGTYRVAAYLRAGLTPASSDKLIGEGKIVWGGESGQNSPVLAAPDGENLVSLAYVKAYLGIVGNTDDTMLSSLIAAASKAITHRCRRTFNLKMWVEDYGGPDDYTLQLNHVPVASLTSVTLNVYGSAEVIAGDQYCYDGGTGQIELKPSSSSSAYFYSGRGVKHQVSYQAGYSTIPADLQQACAMTVKQLYIQRGEQLQARSETIGDYSVTYTSAQAFIGSSLDVESVIDRYTDYT